MRPLDAPAWQQLAGLPSVAIGATVPAYVIALRLQRRCAGSPILNPTLVTILLVVGLLQLTGTRYETYVRSASFIHFMLGPAVGLLAVPLFRQTALIRASGVVIAIALAIGLPAGIVTAVGLAWLLGGHAETLLSLAPKSLTTGIAIGVSQAIGGVPALTAVFVILTGIIGAVCGPATVRLMGISDVRILGLAMGIGSHGIGTARAFQFGDVAGAFSSLGMSLNGVLTAVLLPLFITLLPA
ncbi:MAG TPA: LrgB family protein [Acetobacteraceae bacterium]|nr:LrgB family protein [Acetobacteraceae bacterium]